MAFVVAPFIMLRFAESITVWAHVYFYGIVAVLLSLGLFGLKPVKRTLTTALEKRSKRVLAQTAAKPTAPAAAPTDKETNKTVKKVAQKTKDDVADEDGDEGRESLALGVPDDLAGDIDEARREIQKEIETRRRRGSSATMPSGRELKAAIEERIGRKF